MDSQDREFEALLKRFQLRAPGPFPSEVPEVRRDRPNVWWKVSAIAALVVIAVGSLWIVTGRGPSGTVEIAGDSSYKAGERVGLRSPIESGARESFVWSLDDGSRVEMRAQSTVSFESDSEGAGLRLNNGSVLVSGHVHVVTRDVRVAGNGRTFLVEVQPAGTRIGVLEGEVEVRSGANLKRLRQGEQFTTAPGATLSPLTEAIVWSRRATELAALLPAPAPAAPIVAFTPAPPPRLTRTVVIPAPEPAQQATQPAAPQTAPQPILRPLTPTEETEYRNLLNQEQQRSAAGTEGPGAQIVARECGQCHRPDIGPSQPYANRAAVETLVARQMAYGARVSQSEFSFLVDYLFNKYGAKRN